FLCAPSIDVPLQSGDALEGALHRRDPLRYELAAFRQQDQLRGRRLAFADAVRQSLEALHRAREMRKRADELARRLLGLLADLGFLRGGEQRGLADLRQISSYRVRLSATEPRLRRLARQLLRVEAVFILVRHRLAGARFRLLIR